jgi:hypothetical protein
MLAARDPASTDYWMARWEVWNQNAPNRRIWRVTYGLVTHRRELLTDHPGRSDVANALKAALVRILAFSEAHDCSGSAVHFRRALESLERERTGHGYHQDLFVPGTLSSLSKGMLDAAQSAWVFGGMGSWNDLGFDGADAEEYESVSEQLFCALNDAICAAANETDAA